PGVARGRTGRRRRRARRAAGGARLCLCRAAAGRDAHVRRHGRAAAGDGPRDLQAPGAVGDPRLAADDRLGQGAEVRDRALARGRGEGAVTMTPGRPAADAIVVERHRLGRRREFAALVRLNRPDALNAIDWAMVRALDAAISDVDADRSVRAVLLT